MGSLRKLFTIPATGFLQLGTIYILSQVIPSCENCLEHCRILPSIPVYYLSYAIAPPPPPPPPSCENQKCLQILLNVRYVGSVFVCKIALPKNRCSIIEFLSHTLHSAGPLFVFLSWRVSHSCHIVVSCASNSVSCFV